MDDLDVIRLAVVDNITRKSIARAGMEVKGKFVKGWREGQRGLPDPSAGSPSRSYRCLKNRLKL
jgi:hypothetical protein